MAFNVAQPRDSKGRFGSVPKVIPSGPVPLGVVPKPHPGSFVVSVPDNVSLYELFRVFEQNRVSSQEGIDVVVNDANEWSRSYHLKFDSFPEELSVATNALFAARPSLLSDSDRRVLFEEWVERASGVYGLSAPVVVWSAKDTAGFGGGVYKVDSNELVLSPVSTSITTLLHEFRHALQFSQLGEALVSEDSERDARAWSLSLYFSVRPKLFAKLASEGRFYNVDANIFS